MIAAGGHLSAADIAKLRLPGLPTTKRGVLMLAERGRWSWIERRGRGGGRLYSLTHLPEAALSALEAKRARLVPANLRSVGRPKGSDFFTAHPDVADAVEVILADHGGGAISANGVLEMLVKSGEFFGLELPSRRTLSRFISATERRKAALLASVRDPDLYKSRFRVALGRADGGVTRANQIWELDTTPVDVHLKGGRKAILGVIDRYSRRARFLVADSESGQSVRRLLIDTIRAWGVMPDAVMTDNGSGYINASIVSALEVLGIEHRLCPPGSPEKKPFIERVFGTFTRERAALLPGFAGHNVAQAQKLRARAKKETGRAVVLPELEPAELQAILDNWVDGTYHQREHGGIHATPLARWTATAAGSAKAPAEDVLRIALSKAERTAQVTKRGIVWKRGRYWAPALAAHMDQVVQLRRDEDDLGALFVFDADGNYIDTAVNHERAGMSEEAFAREARRQQAAHMNAAREELRGKQRRFSIEDAKASILRSDAMAAGQLTLFPQAAVVRSTPQLDSIAQAPAAVPPVPSFDAVEAALAKTRRPRSAEPTVAEKVAAADRILAAAGAGEPIDQAELNRAQNYARSSEYKAEKLIAVHFGTDASQPQHRRNFA